MPVSNNAWTTLANVKTHLQIAVTTYDTQLETLIDNVMKFFERYCGIDQLKSKTYTEYYDGDGDNYILTDHRPIISVTSLHDDTLRAFNSDTLIDPINYLIYDKAGMVKLFNQETIFVKGDQNIKLVYVAGYATIPEDAELASRLYVAYIYNQAGTEGHDSISLGGLSKAFSQVEIPDNIKLMLEPFRKRPV